MGEVGTYDLPLEFRDLPSRVSKVEGMKLALEKAVLACREQIDGVESVRLVRAEEAIRMLEECQRNLDRITLPKWSNDLADLDKRISTIERTAGRDMSGRMGRAESRQSEFERRIRDLENHVRGYDEV